MGIVWPGYTAIEPGRNTGGKCRLCCNCTATVLHDRTKLVKQQYLLHMSS